MKKNILAYCIVFLSLCCFIDLSIAWSSFVFIAIATLLFFQQRGDNMPLPPISLLLLANILGYPIVVVTPWLYRDLWAHMNPYTIEFAMLWATRGFAAFCCAYLLGDAFPRRFHRQADGGWNDEERLAYIRYAAQAMAIFSIIAWVLRKYYFGIELTFIASRTALDINSAESSTYQVLDQLINLREPFLFIFGIMYTQRRHDRFMWLLFAGIVTGLGLEIMAIGSKGAIIRLLVLAALLIAYTARRLSLKQFCAGALMILVIYMAFIVITEYRDILLDKYRRGQDVFDVSVQSETFSEALFTSLPFSEKSAARRTTVNEQDIFGRIASGIFSFGKLLYYTGGRSPHEHAWESFLIPVYSFVPRALIEKPVFFSSGRFGKEYFHFRNTAISVSMIGSFYYAWGYGGIVAGMAMLGVTLAFLIRRTLLRSTDFNSMVFMVAMMMSLIDVGVNFPAVGIALCRLVVFLWGLHMLYPAVRRLRSGREAVAPAIAFWIGGRR